MDVLDLISEMAIETTHLCTRHCHNGGRQEPESLLMRYSISGVIRYILTRMDPCWWMATAYSYWHCST